MGCEDEYDILEEIGRGSSGRVYKAQHDSGELHAIKVVELEEAGDELDNIQQEIQMLQAFDCPQLTRYYGSFIVGSALWIAMEYLEGGSLQDLIKRSKDNLDEHTTQWVLRELLKALAYLHLERKIHRDVKAGNILIARDGSVRLADFGESVQLTHSIAKRQTFAGSPYWMAPEVIEAQNTYNSKADIWSLGVTAIEMIKGRPPYSEMHPMKAVLMIPNSPSPTLGKSGSYSKHFHSFLEQCFQRDPSLRPSAQELLRHPFMKSAKRTDVIPKLLEARRTAQVMNSLFGGERGLFGAVETAEAITPKRAALPASAAAAIAAIKMTTASAGGGSDRNVDRGDPEPGSIEWDFDFGDDGSSAGGSVEESTTEVIFERLELEKKDERTGHSGGRKVDHDMFSVPSAEAVTPIARVSSWNSWNQDEEDAREEMDDFGSSSALKGSLNASETRRRRGTMEKVGSVLGIHDAESAASLQKEVTVLARAQEEQLDQLKKMQRLSSNPCLSTPTVKNHFWKPSSFVAASTTASEAVATSLGAIPPTENGRGHGSRLGSSMLGRLLRGVSSREAHRGSGSTSSMSMSMSISLARPTSYRFRPRVPNDAASFLPSRDIVVMGIAGDSNKGNAPGPKAVRTNALLQPEKQAAKPGAEGADVEDAERQLRRRQGYQLVHEESSFAEEPTPEFLESHEPREEEMYHQVQARADEGWGGSPACGVAGSDRMDLNLKALVGDGGDNIAACAPIAAAAACGGDVVEWNASSPSQMPARPPSPNALCGGDAEQLSAEEEPRDYGVAEKLEGEEETRSSRVEIASAPGMQSTVVPSKLTNLVEKEEGADSVVVVAVGAETSSDTSITMTSTVAARSSSEGQSRGGGGDVTMVEFVDMEARARGKEDCGDPAVFGAARDAGELVTKNEKTTNSFDPGNQDGASEGGGVATAAFVSDGRLGDDLRKDLSQGEEVVVERCRESELEGIAGEGKLSMNSTGCGGDFRETVPAPETELEPEDSGDDGLTNSFHAHLTPALCELWNKTEDGSDQRQAVQDLALALEQLDACSGGQLTLDFVERVADSWPPSEDDLDALAC